MYDNAYYWLELFVTNKCIEWIEINWYGLLDFIYSACAIIHHVNMMRCFQVIVLIYSSIYIVNRMAHWQLQQWSISFKDVSLFCHVLWNALYRLYLCVVCIYWSRYIWVDDEHLNNANHSTDHCFLFHLPFYADQTFK